MTSLWEHRLGQLQNLTKYLMDHTDSLASDMMCTDNEECQKFDKSARKLSTLISIISSMIALEEKTHSRIEKDIAQQTSAEGTAKEGPSDDDLKMCETAFTAILNSIAQQMHDEHNAVGTRKTEAGNRKIPARGKQRFLDS